MASRNSTDADGNGKRLHVEAGDLDPGKDTMFLEGIGNDGEFSVVLGCRLRHLQCAGIVGQDLFLEFGPRFGNFFERGEGSPEPHRFRISVAKNSLLHLRIIGVDTCSFRNRFEFLEKGRGCNVAICGNRVMFGMEFIC